jgi:hypothetical protein
MTKYITDIGTFERGIQLLHEKGGQLMPQRSPDHPTTHVRGGVVTTYWPPASRVRGLVTSLATQVGYDQETATGGRICRHIADDIIGVPYKGTDWSQKWFRLAKGGNHWHYLYAKPGLYDYAIEIDVKSAYWSSFMSGKSTLLRGDGTWIDDGGALADFGTLMDTLPKWLRVSMMGGFASWRKEYYMKPKNPQNGWELEHKTSTYIKTGALFNSTHRAIAKVWKFMQALHNLLGDDCLRIHTDGVIINCSHNMDFEVPMEELFKKWGFDYTVKGFGHCWIHDVNSVVLGQKIAGSKRYIRDEMVSQGIKVNLGKLPPRDHRWFSTEPSSEGSNIDMDPVSVITQTSFPFGIEMVIDS